MSNVSNHESDDPTQERLKYLWDEYKYRHGLCWKAIYKIIAVVTLLGVLPYANPEVAKVLKSWMLVPPIIGTLLAAFGVGVVNNELRLFSYIKIAHHVLQKQFLESVLKDADDRERAVDELNVTRARWTLFDIYAHILMLTVFLLDRKSVV